MFIEYYRLSIHKNNHKFMLKHPVFVFLMLLQKKSLMLNQFTEFFHANGCYTLCVGYGEIQRATLWK